MDNFSQIDQQLAAWVDSRRDEIIQTTRHFLQIPSVEGEPEAGAPFGHETRRALDFALNVAAQAGLSTRNLDGYAGHAEWRAPSVAPDAEIVGILAHVDVVPAGEGWKHPPFGGDVEEGRIYGRGAIDDKGPAMAGLFAILAVQACEVPLSRRVRLILGADEESGFECVKHYFAREEMPATGWTPDAMFPLVYAEKGIANAVVTGIAPSEGERIHVVRIGGGLRANMVPDRAEAILEGMPESWPAAKARLNSVVGIDAQEIDGGRHLRVLAKGIASHGSTPEAGLNAIALLCEALLHLDHHEDQVEVIRRIQAWAEDTTGGTLGIAGKDRITGPLTSNLGIIEYGDGRFTLTFNIRYPVDWNRQVLQDKLQASLAGTGFELQDLIDQAPLHVPLDDPLAQTLLAVYRDETGDDSAPLTMGGGTYARVMRKGVAFGPSFPGSTGAGPHEADESWAVADLIRATKIYARALARLANQ